MSKYRAQIVPVPWAALDPSKWEDVEAPSMSEAAANYGWRAMQGKPDGAKVSVFVAHCGRCEHQNGAPRMAHRFDLVKRVNSLTKGGTTS